MICFLVLGILFLIIAVAVLIYEYLVAEYIPTSINQIDSFERNEWLANYLREAQDEDLE